MSEMNRSALPTLTTVQTRNLERLLTERYGLELVQVQENGGRLLAELARRLLDNDIVDRPIVVLAGRGNNGAVGMVAARHLLNWGADVQVLCSYSANDYQGVPAQHLRSLQNMGAPLAWAEEGWELPPCDLVIDAIIGYGLRGDPRGPARDLIQLANSALAPILSAEVPSGLDSEGGTIYAPCVQAAATLCLGLPQAGVVNAAAQTVCGDLYMGDLGIPQALFDELELSIPMPTIFSEATLLPLTIEDAVAFVATEAG